MPAVKLYTYRKHATAPARVRSAHRLVHLLLQPAPDLLPDHRREFLSYALWKLTEADSRHKHRTRFCSESAFANPGGKLRHDHVFQRARMVDRLLNAAPEQIAAILEQAIGCTITEEEHQRLNSFAHLDGWQRYEAAGIAVRDCASA